MNKTILVGMLSLVFAFTPFISHAAFDVSLKYSAKGDAVKELQEFLIDGGYLAAGNNSGNFFSLTLKAVKAFQVANNLPSTGYFGPMSRKVASDLIAADLSASDSQETIETGSTTAPTHTSAIDTLNTQITNLTNQVVEQNQKLGSIVTNTTKVTPAPVVVPQVTKDLILTATSQTIQLTNYNNISIKAVYTEDGNVSPTDITFSASDGTTRTFPKSKEAVFSYLPKVLGVQTITVVANGITKTIDVQVVPYVKIDSIVTGENRNAVMQKGNTGVLIGTLNFSLADETLQIQSAKTINDSTIPNVTVLNGGSTLGYSPLMVKYSENKLYVRADAPVNAGTYSITVESVEAVGQQSGNYRNVQGLPITFTFTVK